MMKVSVVALVFLTFVACKPSVTPTSNSVSSLEGPKRVNANETEPRIEWGTVTFDEKGRVLQKLVLSLDQLPEGKTSGALPECRKPLPATFVLGEAICTKNAKIKMTVTGAQIEQDCYTNPKFEGVEAKQPLQLEGCREARLYGYLFEGNLRVGIE